MKVIGEKAICIGILGLGTVGSGAYEILTKNRDIIELKVGEKVIIKKILVRNLNKDRKVEVPQEILTDNPNEILDDPEINIVVEVLGGETPALNYILQAIENGKHIVTANKEVMAKHGRKILEFAREKGVDVHFEGSVGGGIPIIRPLKQCLAANRIKQIMGIVNGTTNYILTKMTIDGQDFSEALKIAQEKGYAESDPTADVEGFDAAYKLAILASIGYIARVNLQEIYREGISKITKKDINYAKELGCVIKLLAIAKEVDGGLEVRVNPTMLPNDHPLAAVNDVYNAIFVKGDAVGEVMFYGPGAGQMPTGSAVVSDIIEIARDIHHKVYSHILCTCFEERTILPVEEIQAGYYIRLQAQDKPGVLAQIAKAFGDNGVSLASVLQKSTKGAEAEIVWITSQVKEKKLQNAIKEIRELEVVREISSIIRVEGR